MTYGHVGLINCPSELESFRDERPLLLLSLSNHNPHSTNLRGELKNLPQSKMADLRIAASNFLGYGHCDPAIMTLEKVKTLGPELVYTRGP